MRTPETYLGYRRTAPSEFPVGAVYDESYAYQLPEWLPLNQWALSGEWTIGPEKVVLDRAGGTIAFRFHARDAHLVLSSRRTRADPIPRPAGRPGTGRHHGVDVDEHGNGQLRDGRMYQLVREHGPVHEQTLEITFLEPGAEAYAFTFG